MPHARVTQSASQAPSTAARILGGLLLGIAQALLAGYLPPASLLAHHVDHAVMLIMRKRWAFSRSSNRTNGVRSLFNVPIDQLSQSWLVEQPIPKRSDHRHGQTSKLFTLRRHDVFTLECGVSAPLWIERKKESGADTPHSKVICTPSETR